jgi:hypothetical protein
MTKPIFIFFLSLVALSGCSTLATKSLPENNPRIIYRDLVAAPQPVFVQPVAVQPVVEPMAIIKAAPKPTFSPHSKKADYFIPFYNESSKINTGITHAMPTIDLSSHYFLLGHSHGSSAVGNAKLSQARAEAVARYLIQNKVKNPHIHMMASWSSWRDDYSPPKGVEVYVMPSLEKGFLPVGRIYNRD